MFTKDDIKDYLRQANGIMLGKTNRAIAFTRVNNDRYLDPEAPEGEQVEVPSLARLLPFIGNMQPMQFLEQVEDELACTSFREFLDKFKPGFYYRVAPGKASDDGSGEREAQGLAFSLEGGPGWKKVQITADHPYVKSLQKLVTARVRTNTASCKVDVDASFMTMQPRNQRNLMRGQAEDLQASYEAMALQAKRDPASKETARAKQKYEAVANEFAGALEDAMRVLPTVVYGLDQAAREIRRQPGGPGPVDPTIYQIEFGKNRQAIATPRTMQALVSPAERRAQAIAAPQAAAQAIAGPQTETQAISAPGVVAGEGADAADAETEGATETGVAAVADSTSETGVAAVKDADPGTAVAAVAPAPLAVQPLLQALDILREKRQKVAGKALAEVTPVERYGVVLSRFMDSAVKQGVVPESMANMLAVVLQDPKALALESPDIADLEYFHDTWLLTYSTAIEDFLKEVTPLFEQIMGIYLLFNEFPSDVHVPDSMKPRLIVANGYLPDLFMQRKDQLNRFFEIANAQSANQFQNAISFAIVPRVEQFRRQRPAAKPTGKRFDVSDDDDDLLGKIERAQEASAEKDAMEGYDAVAFVDELMELMEWGAKWGFQVLFSPEDKIVSGEAKREAYDTLRDNYALDHIVDKEESDAGILCVPDFILVPPDGKMELGRSATLKTPVGAEVPQLIIRSCFVAAGRLMANDVPAYLDRKLQQTKKTSVVVRKDVPGIGVDLSMHTYLGMTDLPTDHFFEDGVMAAVLDPTMPFTVFTQVAGRSPALTIPRTMCRDKVTKQYRMLHLFRQQHYLVRLLRAAHDLSLGGAFPDDEEEAQSLISAGIDWILTFSGWYNPGSKAGSCVNSFPSELFEEQPFLVTRDPGAADNAFTMSFGFKKGRIGELKLKF